MKFRLRILSCILVPTVIVNLASSKQFGVGESKCILGENEVCGFICAKNSDYHDDPWAVDIISSKKGESCKEVITPENVRVGELRNKMYYVIYMKEGTKESKLIYFKTEPDEVNSTDEIKGSTTKTLSIYDQDTMKKLLVEKERNYIKNTNQILQSMSVNGTIFQHILRTDIEYKNGIISSHASIYDTEKKVNILRDYFSDFKVNATFLPAIRYMKKDAVAAWLHLEKKIESLMKTYISPKIWTYYTIQNGFLDYTSKSDETEGNSTTQPYFTYLMKQVIYENRMIMFLIPNLNIFQYIEYTYKPCIDVCKKFRWIFDIWINESQLIICCDPIQLHKFWDTMKVLYQKMPTHVAIPIKISGDEINILWNNDEEERHFFCGSNLQRHTGPNSKIYLLLEALEENQCYKFVQQQILGENTKITGLAFQFIYNNEYLELASTWEEVNKDWKFYIGRKIFSDPNIWFIKLSESVSVQGGASGYKYRVLSKQLKRSYSQNYTYPGPYNCKTTNSFPISVSEIFMKENVIKMFVKSNPDKTSRKHLKYLWDTHYMIPVPHVSPYDMQFEGFESVNSCTVIPMWSQIYYRYWMKVENMSRKLIKQNDEDADVYTLEYNPLRFTGGGKLIFRLYDGEGNANITVHRFIIKMIISSKGSIAFLTINDVFKLMNDEKDQSIFETERKIVNDLCKLKCDNIVFDTMNYDDKIKFNHCCQVNKKFIKQILPETLELTKEEQKVLSLKKVKKT